MKTIETFWHKTAAIWEPCSLEEVRDIKPFAVSPKGSSFYFSSDVKGDFIVRSASHWGVVEDCYWPLRDMPDEGQAVGKCYLSNFEFSYGRIVVIFNPLCGKKETRVYVGDKFRVLSEKVINREGEYFSTREKEIDIKLAMQILTTSECESLLKQIDL